MLLLISHHHSSQPLKNITRMHYIALRANGEKKPLKYKVKCENVHQNFSV